MCLRMRLRIYLCRLIYLTTSGCIHAGRPASPSGMVEMQCAFIQELEDKNVPVEQTCRPFDPEANAAMASPRAALSHGQDWG